jgi:hypothetical protein
VLKGLASEGHKSGDLIPWTISQQVILLTLLLLSLSLSVCVCVELVSDGASIRLRCSYRWLLNRSGC